MANLIFKMYVNAVVTAVESKKMWCEKKYLHFFVSASVVCMQSSQTSSHTVSHQVKLSLQPTGKIQFDNKHIAHFHVISVEKRCYVHCTVLLSVIW